VTHIRNRRPRLTVSDLEPVLAAASVLFWTRVSIREEIAIIRRSRLGEKPLTDTTEEWHWQNIRDGREQARLRRMELDRVNSPEFRTALLYLFGRRMRKLRLEAGLTQSALAERTAFDVKTISHLERGLLNPRLETLYRIADGIGTSSPTLMQGKLVRDSVCPLGLWPLIMNGAPEFESIESGSANSNCTISYFPSGLVDLIAATSLNRKLPILAVPRVAIRASVMGITGDGSTPTDFTASIGSSYVSGNSNWISTHFPLKNRASTYFFCGPQLY
jgi:transcriptional regulator with XRE-family HTH domain